MKKSWLVAVLMLLCCMAPTTGILAAPRDLYEAAIVSPGRSVGRIHLGMSRERLHEMLGKPMEKGARHEEWWEMQNDMPPEECGSPFIAVDYVDGKVVQIAARIPGVVAPNVFSVDSTLRQIQRRFKGIKRTASYDVVDVKTIFYSNAGQGIGFRFNSDGGKVAGSTKPDCFIVFKPGHHILPSWFSPNQ